MAHGYRDEFYIEEGSDTDSENNRTSPTNFENANGPLQNEPSPPAMEANTSDDDTSEEARGESNQGSDQSNSSIRQIFRSVPNVARIIDIFPNFREHTPLFRTLASMPHVIIFHQPIGIPLRNAFINIPNFEQLITQLRESTQSPSVTADTLRRRDIIFSLFGDLRRDSFLGRNEHTVVTSSSTSSILQFRPYNSRLNTRRSHDSQFNAEQEVNIYERLINDLELSSNYAELVNAVDQYFRKVNAAIFTLAYDFQLNSVLRYICRAFVRLKQEETCLSQTAAATMVSTMLEFNRIRNYITEQLRRHSGRSRAARFMDISNFISPFVTREPESTIVTQGTAVSSDNTEQLNIDSARRRAERELNISNFITPLLSQETVTTTVPEVTRTLNTEIDHSPSAIDENSGISISNDPEVIHTSNSELDQNNSNLVNIRSYFDNLGDFFTTEVLRILNGTYLNAGLEIIPDSEVGITQNLPQDNIRSSTAMNENPSGTSLSDHSSLPHNSLISNEYNQSSTSSDISDFSLTLDSDSGTSISSINSSTGSLNEWLTHDINTRSNFHRVEITSNSEDRNIIETRGALFRYLERQHSFNSGNSRNLSIVIENPSTGLLNELIMTSILPQDIIAEYRVRDALYALGVSNGNRNILITVDLNTSPVTVTSSNPGAITAILGNLSRYLRTSTELTNVVSTSSQSTILRQASTTSLIQNSNLQNFQYTFANLPPMVSTSTSTQNSSISNFARPQLPTSPESISSNLPPVSSGATAQADQNTNSVNERRETNIYIGRTRINIIIRQTRGPPNVFNLM